MYVCMYVWMYVEITYRIYYKVMATNRALKAFKKIFWELNPTHKGQHLKFRYLNIQAFILGSSNLSR
jgi:hypothetical protein